jgi:hypothetical protein
MKDPHDAATVNRGIIAFTENFWVLFFFKRHVANQRRAHYRDKENNCRENGHERIIHCNREVTRRD